MQRDCTTLPYSSHGGVHAALAFELKLQLSLYWPCVMTKQPEMFGRARAPERRGTNEGTMPCM